MMDIDFTKEYRLPMCDSLRPMRIQKYLMNYGSNIFVDDRLESDNYIKIYEYLGGTLYIPASADELKHSSRVVPVAGIKVIIKEEEQVVQVDKIFYELGHEAFIAKLMQQVMDFADFYGLRFSILDLQKGVGNRNIRTCKFVDEKYGIVDFLVRIASIYSENSHVFTILGLYDIQLTFRLLQAAYHIVAQNIFLFVIFLKASQYYKSCWRSRI